MEAEGEVNILQICVADLYEKQRSTSAQKNRQMFENVFAFWKCLAKTSTWKN